MADTPKNIKFTVDGKSVTAEAGEMVLPVLLRNGLQIPHFCYHPKLSVAGVCRICLIEVEGARKLEIACSTPVREGMVVHTHSKKVLEGREFVMEFTLVNHPLDCPDCDQAGECWLQEYYMAHDRKESHMHEEKVHKNKEKIIGPRVILDQERCILCTRCVRFCDEITHTSELGIFNRGDQGVLDIVEGKDLTNPYSENVVDICPVGALTSRDFRFDGRVWFLKESPSICPGCSKGCNTVLHHREERIRRILPRINEEINGHWMCDAGRDVYKWVHSTDRLLKPRILEGNESKEVPWAEAFQKVIPLIAMAQKQEQSGCVVGMASVRCTNEDNSLFCNFMAALFGFSWITWADIDPKTWEGDHLLRQEDCNPNSKGAEKFVESAVQNAPKDRLKIVSGNDFMKKLESGKIRSLFILQQDLLGQAPTSKKEKLKGLLHTVNLIVSFSSHQNETTKHSHVALPITTFAEQDGSFINCDGILQNFEPAIKPMGQATALLRLLPTLAERSGFPLAYSDTSEVKCEPVPSRESIRE